MILLKTARLAPPQLQRRREASTPYTAPLWILASMGYIRQIKRIQRPELFVWVATGASEFAQYAAQSPGLRAHHRKPDRHQPVHPQ